MKRQLAIAVLLGLWTAAEARAQGQDRGRVVLRLERTADASDLPAAARRAAINRVVRARLDFASLLRAAGEEPRLDPGSLRIEDSEGKELPLRFEPRFSAAARSYHAAGDLVFLVPEPGVTRVAVRFGTTADPQTQRAPASLIGDGDVLRMAGTGTAKLRAPACYPCVVDVDGDGRRDMVGSNRYGTGALVTWFRNVGTDAAPRFAEREIYHLETTDGTPISNTNRGWMLTTVLVDWDDDGKRDLLVGGFCRYLTFLKNVGTDHEPLFAPGKVIFDAKVFPGRDYGPDPETIYQGVFIESCDWDGDGRIDLLCGTYKRNHIYFLRATGRDADGLPVLAAPVALEAGGKPIDDLSHCQPSVADWDGDGDLDLMAGQAFTVQAPGPNGTAGCYYFENIGTARAPELKQGRVIRDAEGRVISAGFHAQPTMVDWNRDGVMDVLVSGHDLHLYLNRGTPRAPRLTPALIACDAREPCAVEDFAYPVAVDLDGDGTLDLVVGNGEGNILFFRGLASLEFAAPIKLTSAGAAIDEEGCPDGGEGHRGYTKAAVADWNGDGRRDLIVWTNNGRQGWQGGTLGADGWCLKFFPGTDAPLDFGPPVEVKAAGRHIRAGYRCKPDLADLDGDGLLDLVETCGTSTVNGPCTIEFFRNVGSRTAWELAEPVPLRFDDGRPLDTPVRTAVRLADWDGDGDLDLFTGNHSSFSVRYWENVGTKTRPRFAAARPLRHVNAACSSHHELGVDVVDLDRDGTLDLLVGNGDSGEVHYFRRSFLESVWSAGMVPDGPASRP